MRDRIFLSYRRGDASADARSIYEHLCGTFGKARLFIDVDGIQHGTDFRSALDENLGRCKVLLAIVGQNWLAASDAEGNRRLDDEADYVRAEIAKAIEQDVSVIPVLVGNARMPTQDELPIELRQFSFRQAARVRHESFSQDMEALTRDLRSSIRPARPLLRLSMASALALMVGFGVVFAAAPQVPSRVLNALYAPSVPLNISSITQDCIRATKHPEASEVVRRLATRMSEPGYQYGWRTDSGPVWKKINKVEVAGDELSVFYDYRNGRLRLVPVVDNAYSASSEPIGESAMPFALLLQGSWSQDNSFGCMELKLDDSGFGYGNWGNGADGELAGRAMIGDSPEEE
jgi:hypothetical protein